MRFMLEFRPVVRIFGVWEGVLGGSFSEKVDLFGPKMSEKGLNIRIFMKLRSFWSVGGASDPPHPPGYGPRLNVRLEPIS